MEKLIHLREYHLWIQKFFSLLKPYLFLKPSLKVFLDMHHGIDDSVMRQWHVSATNQYGWATYSYGSTMGTLVSHAGSRFASKKHTSTS
jgi:hypothetical protein